MWFLSYWFTMLNYIWCCSLTYFISFCWLSGYICSLCDIEQDVNSNIFVQPWVSVIYTFETIFIIQPVLLIHSLKMDTGTHVPFAQNPSVTCQVCGISLRNWYVDANLFSIYNFLKSIWLHQYILFSYNISFLN